MSDLAPDEVLQIERDYWQRKCIRCESALRKVLDCIVRLEGVHIEYPLALEMSRALHEGKAALGEAERK